MNILHKYLQKMLRIYLTTEKNTAKLSENIPFLMRSCSIQILVIYSGATVTCKHQHHVTCGLIHGGEIILARSWW